MEGLALISDGLLWVDGGQTDLSLQSEWRNSNPEGIALKKLFIKQETIFIPKFLSLPFPVRRKKKWFSVNFFPLSNWNNDFSFSLTGGLLSRTWNEEIYILCISTRAAGQTSAWQYEVQTGLQPRYDACEQCLSSFIPRWVLLWLPVPGNRWLCSALPHSAAPCWTEAALHGGTAPACGPQLLLASSDAEPLRWKVRIIKKKDK